MAELSQAEEEQGNHDDVDSSSVAEETNSLSAEKEETSPWTELMGKDIQMMDLGIASNDDNKNNNGVNIKSKPKECRPQDAAVIDFVGRLAAERDDEDGPIFHQATDWIIVIGDKYVTPALEMGVRFMSEGKKAAIWSHSKFAHGMSTRKYREYELPPGSNVRYEVHVKKVIVPDEGSSDPDAFQLQLGMSKKLIANDMFQNELYTINNINGGSGQRTLRLYSKAADEMLHLIQSHAAQKEKEGDAYNEEEGMKKTQQATEIMLDCLNNITAVHLKVKNYHQAKEAAVKVLTYDPSNFKALIRAARAAMLDPAGAYEESDAAIAAAEKVATEKGLDDKDVRKLRQELKQKKQEYKQRKKEMMARMTKELKPKEPTAKETTTNQQRMGVDSLSSSADAEVKAKEPPLESSGETQVNAAVEAPSLWRSLLPSAAQLVVFLFVLYFVSSSTKKQSLLESEGPNEEL